MLNRLRQLLEKASYPVIFTGAGMSTESGLPDFRSATGMWKKFSPEELASVHALEHNREEFIAFYRNRLEAIEQYQPHIGHEILAKWEADGKIKSIITQNVDGFHHQAGSKAVYELHGTLRRCHCHQCGNDFDKSKFIAGKNCDCGGFVRPSIVLFGEMLPEEPFLAAERESKNADLFIVLGSSLSVTPANFFPIQAKENGASLVIINMEPTELDGMADLVIHNRKIGELLVELDKELH